MTVNSPHRVNVLEVQTSAYSRSRPSPSLYCHAVQVTRDRLETTLLRLEEMQPAGTTEPVHQVRVWLRRSLAALAICTACRGNEAFITLKRDIKRTVDALSETCDLERVFEMLLQRAETLAPVQRVAVDFFLDHLRRQRLTLLGPIFGAARRLERRRILSRFEEAVSGRFGTADREPITRGGVRHGELQWTQGLEEPISLIGHASRILNTRLEAVLDCERSLYCPDKASDLHQMCLALERLYYTMEIFAEIYIDHDGLAEMFRAALSSLASLQNGLDKIHSADVLVPRLSRFVASRLKLGHGKNKHEDPEKHVHDIDIDGCLVLLTVCQEVRTTRDQDYARFMEEWRQLRSERFFDRLLGLLRAASAEEEDTRW